MLDLHSHLIAEIEFWRDLIDSRHETCPEATRERMRQALALAERKLLLLTTGESEHDGEVAPRTEH